MRGNIDTGQRGTVHSLRNQVTCSVIPKKKRVVLGGWRGLGKGGWGWSCRKPSEGVVDMIVNVSLESSLFHLYVKQSQHAHFSQPINVCKEGTAFDVCS